MKRRLEMVIPSMQGHDSTDLTLDRFLVAYDFSAASDKALEFAVRLAKKHGATIRIVHASRGTASSLKEAERFRGASACIDDENVRRLKDIAERCRTQVPGTESFVIPGDADHVLHQQIASWNPDFCFLGAYGTGPSDRDAIGPTVSALLRSLPCVVVVIGPRVELPRVERHAAEEIVCPIDFPEDVQERLGAIASLATRLHATVDLVHVVDVSHEISRPHNAIDVQYDFDLLVAQLFLQRVVAKSALLYGTPESRIAEYATDKGATYILFGLHKDARCSSYFEHNLVEKVIKNAPCAVMVFPQYVGSITHIVKDEKDGRLTTSMASSQPTEEVEVASDLSPGIRWREWSE
jgi:nucleotide-binding universal stress UspA family protein